MNKAEILRNVLAVVEQYKLDSFAGQITKETKLTDLFGQNQWYTLGFCLIAELEEKLNISLDLERNCETVEDLIKLVAESRQNTSAASLVSASTKEFFQFMYI